jgi:hypothetical protein
MEKREETIVNNFEQRKMYFCPGLVVYVTYP